ncbi:SpoIIIAH-like family protein [Salsuginibacillus kocurii]|uniref:SpoIIIAH-like family protein n=1 Tax=Salsuginibacillus kocurii TaxID=427078 RepID=UPI0003710CC2|nr:SpoIIIAH-like family protein [Salsuginibacillus kocurii]
MVIRKQTIWLMTMISLLVVLGVYYMTAPQAEQTSDEESEPEEQAWEEWLEEHPEAAVSIDEIEDEELIIEEDELPGDEETEDPLLPEEEIEEPFDPEEEVQEESEEVSQDEWFTAMRLEREEMRSREQERLRETIASSDESVQTKNEAHEGKEELQQVREKEDQLEMLIQSKGYSDALVLSENDQVRILVEAADLDSEEAAELHQLAFEELGGKEVAVGYHQP